MTRPQMSFTVVVVLWVGIIWGCFALWYTFLDVRERRRHKNDDEDEIAKRSTRKM